MDSGGGQTLTPGGSAKFPTAKFTTANLTWLQIPPPPLYLLSIFVGRLEVTEL